ncbi:MAG: FlgO family outer membrane protein [Aestuariibacter sp.]
MKNVMNMVFACATSSTKTVYLTRQVGVLLAVLLLAGCATQKIPQSKVVTMKPADVKVQSLPAALGNVELHTSEFADELFGTFRYRAKARNQFRFAVATFVPVATLQVDPKQKHHLELLGHQLEQGMMTELARRGFIAQDYKATNNIIIEDSADRVFSRDVEELNAHHHNIDFYLSGTITETEKGAVVNARIIHVETKDVVAAATRYFPAELFWQEGRVTTRGGMIYRTSD